MAEARAHPATTRRRRTVVLLAAPWAYPRTGLIADERCAEVLVARTPLDQNLEPAAGVPARRSTVRVGLRPSLAGSRTFVPKICVSCETGSSSDQLARENFLGKSWS